jgi:RHS repeat-associated protein
VADPINSRGDNLINQKEQFTYDTQNRLTNWDIHNATSNTLLKTNSMSYDNLGNIATKSDLNTPSAVTLKYENTANPYMLTSISGKPDVIPNDNLDVTYTDFRKIKTLTEGTKQYSITYGVDDQRRRSDYAINGITKTRYYLGDYEEESDNNGNIKKIHYLSGGAVLVQDNGVETMYYGYKDNQGSLIALTDQNGTVVEKYAYDPWGARRNPADWTLKDTRSSFITNRGYTGHEHLDPFNIINMNGRVYDPVTAQFFSPDPFIQSPGDWMNYNGYSYVMNNPTCATDPTGYVVTPQETGPFTHLDGGQVERGEKDWDPYGFHANTYFTDNTGNYFNWNGDDVSFSEVYNNYVLPNSFNVNIKTIYFNGSRSNNYEVFRGFQLTSGQRWAPEAGMEALMKILSGPSESNNANWIDNKLEISERTNDFVDAFAKTLGTYGLTSRMVNSGNAIGRVAIPFGFAIGAAQIGRGYFKDGNQIGYNTKKATASFVGGMAGAWVGFEAGAWAGFESGFTIGLCFDGVGAIPGAVIGGVVGGIGGAFGGAYGGSKLGEILIRNKAQ